MAMYGVKRLAIDFYQNIFGISLQLPPFKSNKRPGLKTYEQAPLYQRTNPYIRTGYRTFFTVRESLESLLYLTNETLNVWTHFFGLIVCCGVLAYDFVRTIPDGTGRHVFESPTELSLVAGLQVAFMCTMICSMAYHTFSCVSEEVYEECFRFDIIGIVICFTGIFFNGIYHGLDCHLAWRNFYFVLVGIASAYLLYSLLTERNLLDPSADRGRTLLFVVWTALGAIPVGHSMYLEGGFSSPLAGTFFNCVLIQYGIGCVAIFFYVSKCPERCMPGRVDYIGHSHQWWHLATLAGCVWWHETVVKLTIIRRDYDCATAALS